MPTSDMPLKTGDIVVVPFPYSDQLAEKRRPALVVSNDPVHRQGLVWLMMVTSAKHSQTAFDHIIRDLAPTGLKVASIVRPIKITCIEPDRILRRAGTLSDDEMNEITAVTRNFLGPATL